ncbi:Hypothetical protein Cp262_1962 [Corynebacterium pseudotuberculosis]|nr:Hypothetical protein Cp262_1962 [Corynebacterium pseudotuberculosis]
MALAETCSYGIYLCEDKFGARSFIATLLLLRLGARLLLNAKTFIGADACG